MKLFKVLAPVGKAVAQAKRKSGRLRLEKLISRGLKIGNNVNIGEGVSFDYEYPYLIEIGDNCRIADGTRFLAHDATTFRALGVTRIAKVRILDGTFIGERSIVLPGVTIGPHALIAAGSVVNRNIGEDMIAAGNPARPYAKYSELIKRYKKEVTEENCIKIENLESGGLTQDDIITMLDKHEVAFVSGLPQSDPRYLNESIDYIQKETEMALKQLFSE